jgi:thiol-disulfide isomerase/thioredoxin
MKSILEKCLPFIVTLLLFNLHFAASGQSANGYKIQIQIPDFADTALYLANYYGEKTYMADTAYSSPSGLAVFEGEEALPGGLYILAVGRNKVIEFIVNQEQFFTLSTEGPDFVQNMQVTGSPENQLFFDYMRFNAGKFQEVQPLQQALKDLPEGDERSSELRDQILQINEEVETYKDKIIQEHPATFLASFFKMMKEIEIPDAPVLDNGRKDSTFAYRYFKQHYWSNTNLADDKLLRTPVFHPKLVRFLDKVIVQHPDSIIYEADRIIDLARPNQEMFKYLVWFITIKYETSKIMGFDAIFVHMVDKYYRSGEAFWVNPTVKENITERADQLRNVLIGKVAPNMIMLDTNQNPVSMHNIQAKYTLLYFWDTDCGHCKKETPKLKSFYESEGKVLGLEVFAVCTDSSYAKMKKYIRQNDLKWLNVNGPRALTGGYHSKYDIYSTPVMYLLDEQKQIIAKRLLTDQLVDFLRKYDEIHARKED